MEKQIKIHRERETLASAIGETIRNAEQRNATAGELAALIKKVLVSCWTCGRYTSNKSGICDDCL